MFVLRSLSDIDFFPGRRFWNTVQTKDSWKLDQHLNRIHFILCMFYVHSLKVILYNAFSEHGLIIRCIALSQGRYSPYISGIVKCFQILEDFGISGWWLSSLFCNIYLYVLKNKEVVIQNSNNIFLIIKLVIKKIQHT